MEENFLSFHPHKKIPNGSFQEIEEKLLHTVQIDENDLPIILEKIEGAPGAPLRIKRLNLEKRSDALTYNLYLELWRKEP